MPQILKGVFPHSKGSGNESHSREGQEKVRISESKSFKMTSDNKVSREVTAERSFDMDRVTYSSDTSEQREGITTQSGDRAIPKTVNVTQSSSFLRPSVQLECHDSSSACYSAPLTMRPPPSLEGADLPFSLPPSSFGQQRPKFTKDDSFMESLAQNPNLFDGNGFVNTNQIIGSVVPGMSGFIGQAGIFGGNFFDDSLGDSWDF